MPSAVFLSYASQDSEAARRICDSLRSSGIEVWFDIEGGLEHGDEWDAKIRRHIKECVLFIPIISANTQARHEGYFRIEWDLAAERARGIAQGVAFILPVVVDSTSEPEALVPDRFRKVQWTKMPGGVVPPEVLARFLKLWAQKTGSAPIEVPKPQGSRASAPRHYETPEAKSSPKTYAIVGVAAALVLAAGGWWLFRGRGAAPAPPPLQVVIAAVPTPMPAPTHAPAAQPEIEQKSVAVLALSNLSPDKGDAYFSDGVSEDLINVLANLPGLKVAARTSTFYFKGK
jgi:hypothetical protein